MERREFIVGAAALAALSLPGASLAAQRFESTRIAVTVEGRGPDVVLIPGLTGSRDVWRGLVRALPSYRYHLVEIAGFGGRPVGGNSSGTVVAPIAAEVARYIRDSGLNSPAIIGHSMGGTIATMVASRYPARVGKLMVVDMLPEPAGLFGSNAAGIRPLADGLFGLLGSSEGGRQLLGSLMTRYAAPGAQAKSDPGLVARATHELALLDLTPELPRIKAPMHVVYALPPKGGTVDPAIIVRDYRTAYAGAKGARLVPIADSGHMIMYDQPARFHAAVKAFLAA